MAIILKITDKNLPYSQRGNKKKSILTGKINQYGYPTCKQTLFLDLSRTIEKAMLTYSLLLKGFEKKEKEIGNQGKKKTCCFKTSCSRIIN